MNSFDFGSRKIGKGENVLIIAEIGVNHEGDFEKCAEMIEAAASSGADSIKLQSMDADQNYVVGSPSYEIFKGTEFSQDQTRKLFDLSRSLGMEPFTTVGDLPTLEWLDEIEPCGYKISSGLLTHIPMIKKIAEKKRPILLSTGLATISDIDLAISILEQSACQNYALFQCTSLYPPKNEFVNLSTIKWLEERYKVPTGYSDHTLGIDVPVLSVAAGAVMIEKHFTLDKNRQGYDHGISLEPSEFKEMVSKIRLTEVLLGQAEKMLPNEVQEKREMFNRTIVATKKIDKGDILSEANIAVRRPIPGKRGLDPVHYDNIIGFRYTVDVNKDWPILAENVEGYE